MSKKCIAGLESRLLKRAWCRQVGPWTLTHYLQHIFASAYILAFRRGGYALSIFHLNGKYLGNVYMNRESLGEELYCMLKHVERNHGII